ncbi:MAG: hypothetical protein ABEK50_15655 [bacterium]
MADIRLVRGSRQIPYIRDDRVIRRRLRDVSVKNKGVNDDNESHWVVELSHDRLPLMYLSFLVKDNLFDRPVVLYETVSGRRGEKRRRLGTTRWR